MIAGVVLWIKAGGLVRVGGNPIEVDYAVEHVAVTNPVIDLFADLFTLVRVVGRTLIRRQRRTEHFDSVLVRPIGDAA